MTEEEKKIAVLTNEIKHIQSDIREIKETLKEVVEKIESHAVSKTEFTPIKRLVYGLVASVLLWFINTVLQLVSIR